MPQSQPNINPIFEFYFRTRDLQHLHGYDTTWGLLQKSI